MGLSLKNVFKIEFYLSTQKLGYYVRLFCSYFVSNVNQMTNRKLQIVENSDSLQYSRNYHLLGEITISLQLV